MKKEETRARSAPNSGSAAEQSASATAAAAAASLAASLPPQPAGTGIIISGGAGGPATPADAAAAAAAAAATAVTLTPPEKPKKGKKNRNSKKRLGFGSVGGAAAGADSSTPVEQLTFKCELCNVTVNSQQQLDLHLTGKLLSHACTPCHKVFCRKAKYFQLLALSFKNHLKYLPLKCKCIMRI